MNKPIETVAPTAPAGDAIPPNPSWPATPPAPLGIKPRAPVFRPLKVYAFGPSLGRARGNIRTINVRYEKLAPGPVGERIAVVDYDGSRDCFYDPVDLDDPLIAINGGLDPSESDPHFHQQMVYAVASETLRRIEAAVGRTLHRRSPGHAVPLRLVLYPHAGALTNAKHSIDGKIIFGYFRAEEKATGRTVPGQTIFTCLSHDVVVHEASHVLVSALRPDLTEDRYLDNLDNAAFLEAMCDLTPLLFHFNNREVVLDTIQRTAGVIYRSKMDESDHQGAAPRILAELASNNPLLALSQDFGDALGQASGLRSALAAADPAALERATEPHERGAIMVAAVFDALFSIYQGRTIDLFRIYRAGGGQSQGNDVPEPLANRLCDEVERIANRVFNMCWRALDYCPAGQLVLGDFLRAFITADYEYIRDDPWGLRDAMMQAFRLRGIKPANAPFFSEDTLRWPLVDETRLKSATLELSNDSPGALRAFVEGNACTLGFGAKAKLDIYPLETVRLTAPDDTPQSTSVTQVIETSARAFGVALVFDGAGRLRYAIPSSPADDLKGRRSASY